MLNTKCKVCNMLDYFRYRIRKSNSAGVSAWSVIITVNTTRKPKTSEDLIRAVNHKDLAKVDAILQGNFNFVFDSIFLTVSF